MKRFCMMLALLLLVGCGEQEETAADRTIRKAREMRASVENRQAWREAREVERRPTVRRINAQEAEARLPGLCRLATIQISLTGSAERVLQASRGAGAAILAQREYEAELTKLEETRAEIAEQLDVLAAFSPGAAMSWRGWMGRVEGAANSRNMILEFRELSDPKVKQVEAELEDLLDNPPPLMTEEEMLAIESR